MDFFKALKEREFETKEDIASETVRQFLPIRITDELWLSIQGGYGYYSKPRENLQDLNWYTHWEFSLFNDDGFVSVSDALPNFYCLAEIEEYSKEDLYSFVPTDLVEELYLELKKVLQVADI